MRRAVLTHYCAPGQSTLLGYSNVEAIQDEPCALMVSRNCSISALPWQQLDTDDLSHGHCAAHGLSEQFVRRYAR